MGGSNFESLKYKAAVSKLQDTGQTFARATQARATGVYSNLANILDPKQLKNGVRESCFAPGFNDATPVVVSMDGTGSMEDVPYDLQKSLPTLMTMLTEQGISDHPNIMFMQHDDEHAVPPDAAFQMSQFETGAEELITALNEMVIPHQGGGNRGEAYHLPLYAAARHTRLECFERDGTKGFLFIIGDEEPFYGAGDPKVNGTSPEVAKAVFGDHLEKTVTMLESLKEAATRYHVFVIRPGHTLHGKDRSITKMWQDLFRAAGEDPERILEIPETEAIIATMVMTIARTQGVDGDEIEEILKQKGAPGAQSAAAATKAIMPVGGGALATAASSSAVVTTRNGGSQGRKR